MNAKPEPITWGEACYAMHPLPGGFSELREVSTEVAIRLAPPKECLAYAERMGLRILKDHE